MQEGLPTEIIKGCAQDSQGYFWVTTDEGIARYDGLKFKSYPGVLHSNYTKGFLTKKDGQLIIFGDLDIYNIYNKGDSVRFKATCNVARVSNDSTVSYPKYLFEDSNSSIWISEAQSIVKLSNGSTSRYEFGTENRTTQFLRSFAIFEDLTGTVYTSSYQGNVFQYNEQTDSFEKYNRNLPPLIEFAEVIGSQLVIGASNGLYTANLLERGGFGEPKLIRAINTVSFIKKVGPNKLFVATRGTQHYLTDTLYSDFELLPYSINNINNIYLSDENDIWISSNEGLILLRENLFKTIGSQGEFIESSTYDSKSNHIYYATQQNLFEFDPESNSSRLIRTTSDGYFQSLESTSQGLWVADAFETVLLNGADKEISFNFREQGRFVTEIAADSQDNLWLTVPGHKYAYRVTDTLNLIKYPIDLGNEGVINIIKEGKDGIYLGSSGKGTYLFRKGTAYDQFENISKPIHFNQNENIEISDLAFTEDAIFLASSIGLLKYSNDSIVKVNLDKAFTNLPVRSVEEYANGKILFANAFGLILYDPENDVADLFNESHGLSSRTISQNGIVVTANNGVWVSTSEGLSYSTSPLTKTGKTKIPHIVEVKINGTPLNTLTDIEADYGSYIEFYVSSITFPEKDINYQYRFGPDDNWKNTSSLISFTNLKKPGEFTLEVRAQKYGPYNWSDIIKIDFTIDTPYWMEFWFISTVFGGILGLMIVTSLIVRTENRMQNYRLQILVKEKTSELQQANEHLAHLNEEKNNLIGIVAHDLKSPLSQIIGFAGILKEEVPSSQGKKFVGMIDKAAWNIVGMIDKFLDINRFESGNFKLEMENLDISKIVNDVTDQYFNKADEKQIKIHKEISNQILVETDREVTKHILDNLISNALKFSEKGSNVYIGLSMKNDKAIMHVKDEGPGLSSEDQKKLFKKFQKLSARPTGNESSSGLGLSIVKRFVDALGGDIKVESELGKGANFIVELPLAS